MREIRLPLPGRDLSYRLVIEPGLRHRLGPLLSPFRFPPQVVVIADRRVARLHGAARSGLPEPRPAWPRCS